MQGPVAAALFERSPQLLSKRRWIGAAALTAAETALPPDWRPTAVCTAHIGADSIHDREAAGIVACCDRGLVVAQGRGDGPATAWVFGWEQIDRLEIGHDAAQISSGTSTWPLVPVWHAKNDLFDAIRMQFATVESAASLASGVGGASLLAPLNCRLDGCTVLGGFGIDLAAASPCALLFLPDRLEVETPSRRVTIPYASITGAEITGPGTQRRDAGVIGGGVGVTGAVTGLAVAALINAATNSASITTIVRLELEDAELWVLVESLEPMPLRILLSPLFGQLRSAARTGGR